MNVMGCPMGAKPAGASTSAIADICEGLTSGETAGGSASMLPLLSARDDEGVGVNIAMEHRNVDVRGSVRPAVYPNHWIVGKASAEESWKLPTHGPGRRSSTA